MVCRKCRWTFCARCSCRPKLPPLESDPLFYGRHSPCLLEPIQAGAAAASRGTVIVCPGGNYEFRVPHEGMPAAEWLAGHGIRAYVLRYRLLPDYGLTEMLDDLASAVACVRRCHRGPVVAMGFSAGGHLHLRLSTRLGRKLHAWMPRCLCTRASTVLIGEIQIAAGFLTTIGAFLLHSPCLQAVKLFWVEKDSRHHPHFLWHPLQMKLRLQRSIPTYMPGPSGGIKCHALTCAVTSGHMDLA